ncbi:MAG: hypothetical protein ABH811_02240 [archaeon]
MRNLITSIIFVILLSSFISADMIINTQPKDIYNLGDTISIPITIKAQRDLSGSFQMNLLCSGNDVNFYKNGIMLFYGEEQKMDPSLVLTKDVIGSIIGTCKIKASLPGEEPILTNEFKISDLVNVNIKEGQKEFRPGESIFIEGYAIKENQKEVNGFIEIKITTSAGEEIDHLETIKNGYFSANISLENNAKAGEYILRLHAYEKNFLGETTNQGFGESSVIVIQVPKSLEIIFEQQEVDPGTNLQIKSIIHDQTGENIAGILSTIQIKNKNGLVLEQVEKYSDESFEYPIGSIEPPAEWTVIATSGKLTNEATFKIKEKKDVQIEIINKTLMIINIGNVFYNDTVLVKIGNQSIPVNVSLDVLEDQKYVLNAPDGEYEVEIMADGEIYTQSVMLTGKTIGVKESKEGAIKLMRYPIVWIFITFILGFVSFMVIKKGYKKSFIGYIHSKKNKRINPIPLKNKSLIKTTSKAELTLSLKGEKQSVSLICLKIKNLKEIENKKSNAEEILQKIVNEAETYKSAVYENQENLFFILAPVKTRTFKNENTAIELSQKIKDIITEHNKLAKQKIEFGMSLNYGNIIAKQEEGILKFMSLGTLITAAKKIASLSDKKILLSDKMNERVISNVKTEKQTKLNVTYYTIKEIKKQKEENKKFIRSFLERIEGDRK